jgi:phage baseplate assembly protein W
MARNTRTFSDLDLRFTAHPVTGDINILYDETAIKRSLKQLILTSHYERPFHSEIGSPIRALLFEPAGPLFSVTLKQAIINTIFNFEPRVVVTDVVVRESPDNNEVYVSIEFKIVNTESPISVDLVLERTR